MSSAPRSGSSFLGQLSFLSYIVLVYVFLTFLLKSLSFFPITFRSSAVYVDNIAAKTCFCVPEDPSTEVFFFYNCHAILITLLKCIHGDACPWPRIRCPSLHYIYFYNIVFYYQVYDVSGRPQRTPDHFWLGTAGVH